MLKGTLGVSEWLQDTFKVLGAVAIVVGVTALTVVTAGVAAYALGASSAMIGAITTGATIGGLVAGDAYTGKLSSSAILKLTLDDGLKFSANQLLMMSRILIVKNVWRHRGLFKR